MPERRKRSRAAPDRRAIDRDRVRLTPSGTRENRRREPRERLTVKLPRSVLDKLRDAVYYTPGLTVSGFIEKTILAIVEAMEQERGQPFPRRKADLRPGRPRTTGDAE